MPKRAKGAEEPLFFETASAWRSWLEAHHAGETSLLVGMRRAGSGRASMTWSESVDEALCFGWIDGVRRSMGREAYTIRFSVRKKASIWSRINIAKAEALIASGRMRPPGLAAFKAMNPDRSNVYSYEQRSAELEPRHKAAFMADRKAWAFFEKQAPSYRKMAASWVNSAKRAETREARLAKLMECSRSMKRL